MCLPTKTLASACWRWGVALGLVGVSVVYSRPALGASISAIWVNDGGDKVTQDELRVTQHKENLTGKVINRTWDGTTIHLYGARNEIVSFNLVLEAPTAKAANVSVSFDKLSGPNGAVIQNDTVASGNGVFSWVGRPIELFYVRYLKIDGLSYFAYVPSGDKTVPIRFQQLNGSGWTGRPDHDKYYPDIMIPYELVKTFDIQASQNQSIWADVYIPKGLTPGV